MKKLSTFYIPNFSKFIEFDNFKELSSNRDLAIYIEHSIKWFYAPMDRSLTFEMPLHYKIHHPIQNLQLHIQSYSDAVNSRACELLDLAEKNNKNIYVMWSGGPDSTVILSSLIINSSPSQKERLIVLLSQGSIKEHPKFFNDFILSKLKYQSSLHSLDKILLSNSMLIHGECNDQLFGRPLMARILSSPIITDIATENTICKVFNEKDEDLARHWFYIYKESARSKGIELKLITDFIWWREFCFHWQNNSHRMFYVNDFPTYDKINGEIICFFETNKFDQWSMQNMINRNWVNFVYKKESKDYIIEFDKDQQYFENKGKVNSGGIITGSTISKTLIDESFNEVDISNILEYYNPDNIFSNYR